MESPSPGVAVGTSSDGVLRPDFVWLMLTVRADDGSARNSAIPRAYAEAPDEDLIGWSNGGDRRAFDEIVLRHGPFALRVARRLIPDRSLAQDIVQEAMVRAWCQAEHFDRRRARLTTWLYRIVVNLCIDQRRRVRPETRQDHFDPEDPAANAAEQLEMHEQEAALGAALERLPVRQRAAMTLVYDEGLSGAEAARILGLSPKAVERLLARARAQLRERLLREPTSGGGD